MLDYKGILEINKAKKSKLWEELKDFLLDWPDEDPYLSNLQLKKEY